MDLCAYNLNIKSDIFHCVFAYDIWALHKVALTSGVLGGNVKKRFVHSTNAAEKNTRKSNVERKKC